MLKRTIFLFALALTLTTQVGCGSGRSGVVQRGTKNPLAVGNSKGTTIEDEAKAAAAAKAEADRLAAAEKGAAKDNKSTDTTGVDDSNKDSHTTAAEDTDKNSSTTPDPDPDKTTITNAGAGDAKPTPEVDPNKITAGETNKTTEGGATDPNAKKSPNPLLVTKEEHKELYQACQKKNISPNTVVTQECTYVDHDQVNIFLKPEKVEKTQLLALVQKEDPDFTKFIKGYLTAITAELKANSSDKVKVFSTVAMPKVQLLVFKDRNTMNYILGRMGDYFEQKEKSPENKPKLLGDRLYDPKAKPSFHSFRFEAKNIKEYWEVWSKDYRTIPTPTADFKKYAAAENELFQTLINDFINTHQASGSTVMDPKAFLVAVSLDINPYDSKTTLLATITDHLLRIRYQDNEDIRKAVASFIKDDLEEFERESLANALDKAGRKLNDLDYGREVFSRLLRRDGNKTDLKAVIDKLGEKLFAKLRSLQLDSLYLTDFRLITEADTGANLNPTTTPATTSTTRTGATTAPTLSTTPDTPDTGASTPPATQATDGTDSGQGAGNGAAGTPTGDGSDKVPGVDEAGTQDTED